MDKKDKKEVRKSRREFLGTGVAAGAGIALGVAAGNLLKEQRSETVKMMTADGQLVEVEKRFVPKKEGKAVTNKELKNWMDEHKK